MCRSRLGASWSSMQQSFLSLRASWAGMRGDAEEPAQSREPDFKLSLDAPLLQAVLLYAQVMTECPCA